VSDEKAEGEEKYDREEEEEKESRVTRWQT
jgi:hypothetical protein